MFNLIMTFLTDLFSSLRLTRGLEFMSIVVVLMLFSSPGVIATIIGGSVKLGIFDHLKKKPAEE